MNQYWEALWHVSLERLESAKRVLRDRQIGNPTGFWHQRFGTEGSNPSRAACGIMEWLRNKHT